MNFITRKAALPIDENKDVIKKRYMIRGISLIQDNPRGNQKPSGGLVDNPQHKKLIDLTVQILNEGLRPHLTSIQSEIQKMGMTTN